MKKNNEENLKQELPQLQLNESAKERIHTTLLNHQPSPPSKKRSWKGSKWGSLVAAALGIFIFSLLTVYIISETEKEREQERYVQAEEEIQAVYEEMEGNLQSTEEGQMLNPIEESKVNLAQSSLKKVEASPDKEELTSLMREIEIYNQAVPQVNELQTQINDVNKTLSQSVFDKDLGEKISSLKKEVTNKLKKLGQLGNPSLKAFLSKHYTAQMDTLEKEFETYTALQEDVQDLKKMAVEQSVDAQEFEQKSEEVMSQVNRLENKKMAARIEKEINTAKAEFQELMAKAKSEAEEKAKAEAEENKRMEEERVAQKRRKEQASKSKEVNASGPVSKEKEESLDESSPEDELYPMEFTMTGPNGHTFKLSRDFSIYKIGKEYDDIARRYGARFYYTPNSDVSNVIIGRKIIATVSLVSAAKIEYKDLFIDLMTFRSKHYTREQFAALVDTVIQSGEPYKVEEGNSGELLKLENGTFIYHSW
ncbi:hypothetical protein CN378_10600 [Bacillus sp. AFS015802]|uniref:hypothetical protein n=1 Tax=Bacillus sp. AFS015802 TaxID=2033486 RepID=UPI000BF32B14|nr:hypothetical protein [Bacillus sp. AFS015802]PFA67289.1 hypothetical protein CN378_10600 [Bacillus sp. AFS015802]